MSSGKLAVHVYRACIIYCAEIQDNLLAIPCCWNLNSAVIPHRIDEILVFDLINDALGYIMPDQDFVYFRLAYDAEGDELYFADSWGLTSIGGHAASDVYGEFYKLYDSVR